MQHERQWLYLWSAFDLVDLLDSVGIKTAARKAVHRFRRHGDELARCYERSRFAESGFSYYLCLHQLSACLLSFSA